jgi:hypothetical protein
MWLVEHVSLVDFCRIHLEEVRRRGFKLLILALIREADAPGFYEDLRRYWTSLDDVTGDHIVFAVAGGAALPLAEGSGFWVHQSGRSGVAHNPQFALPPSRKRTAMQDTFEHIRSGIAASLASSRGLI